MSKDPQKILYKHLKEGRTDLARKDIKNGAVLFMSDISFDGLAPRYGQHQRVSLLSSAMAAPSCASIEWLLKKEPSLLGLLLPPMETPGPAFDNLAIWRSLIALGSAATLNWASDHLFSATPAFTPDHRESLLQCALGRTDSLGLALLAHEGQLLPDTAREPDRPLIWQAVNDYRAGWVNHPEKLVDRLELLVPLGFTARVPNEAILASPLGVVVLSYMQWRQRDTRGENEREVMLNLERHVPRIWDLLVEAGADPEQSDINGHPLLRMLEGTPLGNRYVAQQRASHGLSVSSANQPRRRHRP